MNTIQNGNAKLAFATNPRPQPSRPAPKQRCLSIPLARWGLATIFLLPLALPAANQQLLGWNNLGMHCMDSDYSVFSILPPYNTLEAQLIVGGRLITNLCAYTVAYQAVADPSGSLNTTSQGKGNFYQFTPQLYGAFPVDLGLAGFAMPGTNNTPQGMAFDLVNSGARVNWFRAEGIPLTPYDDAGMKNPYPMMRIIAHDPLSRPIATNDIVLPVSDEMDCRACHASGSDPNAMPPDGWVWAANPERDFRLNILRSHDWSRFQGVPLTYPAILATNGFNVQGLYRTVVADGKPVLCAKCHLSEALPGTGVAGIPPLTQSVHGFHAGVVDPDLGIPLDFEAARGACYRCHPGSATKCLRGAMGAAIASNGTMAMQCQSCHGPMSTVGSANRIGWLNEPSCQNCHTGTASSNNGQIRFTSAFDTNGLPRVAVNQTFATTSNAPPGVSLYRFSNGHGGLQCSACHGSTHAEFPTIHTNDNVASVRVQGHVGKLSECTACHTNSPSTVNGGPHGMHPVGQAWVSSHQSAAEGSGRTACAACHGADYRGTVLSRALAARSLSAFGAKTFWQGFQIGCYTCHQGPSNDNGNPNSPAVVINLVTNTTGARPISFTLPATDPNGDALTLRIVSQPAHGAVGLTNNLATYFPDPGFVGTDVFTYAAWDGSTDSNLGTGTVTVAPGPCSISARAYVPTASPLGWPTPFRVVPAPSNIVGSVSFAWNFGDGGATDAHPYPTHTYASPGAYNWSVVCTVSAGPSLAVCTNQGFVTITSPEKLYLASLMGHFIYSWPTFQGDALLEWTGSLAPVPAWSADTNAVSFGTNQARVMETPAGSPRFSRLRRVE